jgi:5-methylcytosine-specific restriction enzyme subunit McrC
MQSLTLSEWQTAILPDVELTPADRRLLARMDGMGERRLDVDELRKGVRIRSRQWVGTARFEGFEVRVEPKLAGGDLGLVRMIDYAAGIGGLHKSIGGRTLATGGAALVDLLALLLVEQCGTLLRGGLLTDYVEREDDLPVVRGRLLAARQIAERFGRADRLLCRYDEHGRDVDENIVLAAALAVCARRTGYEPVRRSARELAPLFGDPADLDPETVRAARGRIGYNRLNKRYRDAHELAWLVLDGAGVDDMFASGAARCFAFFVDMNRIFERFTYRLLADLLDPSRFRVRYQYATRSVVRNAATGEPYSRAVPDVVVEGDARRIAVDAKYKLYDSRSIAARDVYQSFLYAHAFGAGPSPTALLVYPASAPSLEPLRLHVHNASGVPVGEVSAVGLWLPTALEEALRREQGPATTALLRAIDG